jgi:hypothetical protein
MKDGLQCISSANNCVKIIEQRNFQVVEVETSCGQEVIPLIRPLSG